MPVFLNQNVFSYRSIKSIIISHTIKCESCKLRIGLHVIGKVTFFIRTVAQETPTCLNFPQ